MEEAFVNQEYLRKLIDFCVAFLAENGTEFAPTFAEMEQDFYDMIVNTIDTMKKPPGHKQDSSLLLSNILTSKLAAKEYEEDPKSSELISWKVFESTTPNICYMYVAEALLTADENEFDTERFVEILEQDPALLDWQHENEKFIKALQKIESIKNAGASAIFATAKVDSEERKPKVYAKRLREEEEYFQKIEKESDELYKRTISHPIYKILQRMLKAVRTLEDDRKKLRIGLTSVEEIENKFEKAVGKVVKKKDALEKELDRDRVDIRLYEKGKREMREGTYKKLLEKVYPKIDFTILKEKVDKINRIAKSTDIFGMYAFIYSQYTTSRQVFFEKAYEQARELEDDEIVETNAANDNDDKSDTQVVEQSVEANNTSPYVDINFNEQMKKIVGEKSEAFINELVDKIAVRLRDDAHFLDLRIDSHFKFLHELFDVEKTQLQKKLFPMSTIRHFGKLKGPPTVEKMTAVLSSIQNAILEANGNYLDQDQATIEEMDFFDETIMHFNVLIESLQEFEGRWFSFFDDLTGLEDSKKKILAEVYYNLSYFLAGNFISSLDPKNHVTTTTDAFIESIKGGVSLDAIASNDIFNDSLVRGVSHLSRSVREQASLYFRKHLKEIFADDFYEKSIANTLYFLYLMSHYYPEKQHVFDDDQTNIDLIEMEISGVEIYARLVNIFWDHMLALNDPDWEPIEIEDGGIEEEEFESFSLHDDDDDDSPLTRLKKVHEEENPQSSDKAYNFTMENEKSEYVYDDDF